MSEILIESIDITEELRSMLDDLFPSGLILGAGEAALVPAAVLGALDMVPRKTPPETPPAGMTEEEEEERYERHRRRFMRRRRATG